MLRRPSVVPARPRRRLVPRGPRPAGRDCRPSGRRRSLRRRPPRRAVPAPGRGPDRRPVRPTRPAVAGRQPGRRLRRGAPARRWWPPPTARSCSPGRWPAPCTSRSATPTGCAPRTRSSPRTSVHVGQQVARRAGGRRGRWPGARRRPHARRHLPRPRGALRRRARAPRAPGARRRGRPRPAGRAPLAARHAPRPGGGGARPPRGHRRPLARAGRPLPRGARPGGPRPAGRRRASRTGSTSWATAPRPRPRRRRRASGASWCWSAGSAPRATATRRGSSTPRRWATTRDDVVRFSYRGGQAPSGARPEPDERTARRRWSTSTPPAADDPGLDDIPVHPYDKADSQQSVEQSAQRLGGPAAPRWRRPSPACPSTSWPTPRAGSWPGSGVVEAGADGTLPATVENLVTVGSPHQGVPLATARRRPPPDRHRPTACSPRSATRAYLDGVDDRLPAAAQLSEASPLIEHLHDTPDPRRGAVHLARRVGRPRRARHRHRRPPGRHPPPDPDRRLPRRPRRPRPRCRRPPGRSAWRSPGSGPPASRSSEAMGAFAEAELIRTGESVVGGRPGRRLGRRRAGPSGPGAPRRPRRLSGRRAAPGPPAAGSAGRFTGASRRLVPRPGHRWAPAAGQVVPHLTPSGRASHGRLRHRRRLHAPVLHPRNRWEGTPMAPVVTMRQLLEAGVHFGHQTRRWNPKMKRFIHGERNGIYIIDLQQTLGRIETAYTLRPRPRRRRRHDPVRRHQEAGPGPGPEPTPRSAACPTSTSVGSAACSPTSRPSPSASRKMKEYQRMRDSGEFEAMPKKEALLISRELEKLERNLGGIRNMERLPDAIFVLDTKKEAHRRHRGQQARPPDRRGGRHQLRPRHHPVRHPRQRRRHPLGQPHVPRDRRRRRGGPLHRLPQAGANAPAAAPVVAERTAEEEAAHAAAAGRGPPSGRRRPPQEREARIAAEREAGQSAVENESPRRRRRRPVRPGPHRPRTPRTSSTTPPP